MPIFLGENDTEIWPILAFLAKNDCFGLLWHNLVALWVEPSKFFYRNEFKEHFRIHLAYGIL